MAKTENLLLKIRKKAECTLLPQLLSEIHYLEIQPEQLDRHKNKEFYYPYLQVT